MTEHLLDPDAPAEVALDEFDPAPGATAGATDADASPHRRIEWRRLARRAGHRVIRRPKRWLDAPWPTERIVQYITALVIVGGSTFFVIQIVHPDLVFTNNTPTGGDMGAHVLGPAYLRDALLPNFQLSGWSNDWYAGLPMYRFYMVIPALGIVALNALWIPYGVAFKIVAVLGLVTLPFCCWAFGRLARFRYPMPELMALAGFVFLLDESFSIYGGNVKSTMAGEFSFSIALSLGILGLGLFCRGLETGKYRSWAAIVLALAMLSHGIVLLFVAGGAVLLWLVWMDRTRFRYGLTVLGAAVLLSAFWVVPFLFNHQYMTDMKYHARPEGASDSFWDMFFQYSPFWDIVVGGLAIVGFLASVLRRQLAGAWLGTCCLALMAGTYLATNSLPVIGLLWNPRLLPFLYLLRLMLMMVGIVELVHFVVRARQGVHELASRALWISGVATAAVVTLVVLVVELFAYQVPDDNSTLGALVTKNGKTYYTWDIFGWNPISVGPNPVRSVADGWTAYNFNGYEGRPYYAEYKSVVDTMGALGADPQYGCGRALWENSGANGNYGTTMALMLLPHWTNGCISSMEGLFFEASGTTPYHFITAAAMSASSSNPVRELRYDNNNAAKGVPYMQTLGVKYLMVQTQAAKDQADTRPELTLVRTVGPWNVYEVAGSDIVEALDTQPVVANHRDGDQRERHLELGTSWFQHRDEWAAMPADDGPAEWQRIDVKVDPARSDGLHTGDPNRHVDIVVPSEPIAPVALPHVEVSNIDLGEQDLTFDVDQVGVPVLVKMSYFPNWEVDGAKGPYRIAPNLMVVVPTSTHVRLHFERSTTDYVAYLLTLIGIGLLVFYRRRGDVRHVKSHPFDPAPRRALAGAGAGAADPAAFDWDWAQPPPDPTIPMAHPDLLDEPFPGDVDRDERWGRPPPDSV